MSIRCENVSFKYGIKLILNDISINFGKGHLYGILGPNGSGKTTFLKILSGILKSYYGNVVIDESEIKDLSIREIAKIVAVVPQSTLINFDFCVKDIVMMGRYTYIERFSQESIEDKNTVNDILDRFDLFELKDRSFNELSGGEQQKVIIARAIAQQSQIILLDEPTTHLDIYYQIEFMELLKKYVNDGLVVIIVLHDINMATQFCDKIILLNEGRIKAFGSVDEIITRKNMKSLYNIDVVIRKNLVSNSVYVTPFKNKALISLKGENGELIKRVHVIAGGGTALEILPRLKNYDVSLGVINVLDDDYILANELNYKMISETPFSPISEESIRSLKDLLKNVDLIILTNVSFGKGNLKNLEILSESDKKILIFENTPIEERDFTGGIATIIYNRIKKEKNAKIIHDLSDLLNFENSFGGN